MTIRRPLLGRRGLCAIALLLLIAMGGWLCWIQRCAESSRMWLEVQTRATSCYQGPPYREILNVRLWSGGPGLRLLQERQVRLRLMEEVP